MGVRWGLAGGAALASIDEAREVARYAVDHLAIARHEVDPFGHRLLETQRASAA